jgi:putative salt-induced outer membrane protein YdiY
MNPEDVRLLNTAAINTKLSDVFTLKLSNQLTFDNVPVEGFQKLDQTTMVTFVASIF